MHCSPPSLPDPIGQGRPRLEIADIFRTYGPAFRESHAPTAQQRKVMRAIETCRTSVLGGHVDVCPQCGDQRPSYNSCRDRHCPKCQALRQAQWIAERQARILPTHYFHVVFTIPEQLKPLARDNRERFFALLFKSAAETLLALGNDPKWLGAQLGITAVLHTWTRDLRFHPHIHCVVTGGGLHPDGDRWISTKRRFLFPVRVLSRVFRGKLLAHLSDAWRNGELVGPELVEPRAFNRLKDQLFKKEWVVYAKPPFGGPSQVFNYLGRYTHRVAMSNQRLLSVDPSGVRFVTRGARTATITPEQFIGRFLLHVLPERFVKMRHFGLMAPGCVNTKLVSARHVLEGSCRPLPRAVPAVLALVLATFRLPRAEAMGWRLRLALVTGLDTSRCRACGAAVVRVALQSAHCHPVAPDSS